MSSTESPIELSQFEQLRSMVESEFEVEEALIEYGTPTFYVKLRPDSKQAFLRLFDRLDAMQFVPILRRREEKNVLQVVSKPPVKPSRPIVNLILFVATVSTILLAGYLQSLGLTEANLLPDPIIGALTFTGAIVAIIGSHEMGHKLTANWRSVEASYPYFIPAPPPLPIGTFGAVIQQKSLAPNRDALFDIGVSGPLIGFMVTILVTVIGVHMSFQILIKEAERIGAQSLEPTLLFYFIATALQPNLPPNHTILLHPVAFAGYVGMLVTMLNLVPAGMLDGGHATRGLLGEKGRAILSFLAIVLLLLFGLYPWAIIALLLSLQRHPGPLDDVSKLSNSRKLTAVVLIVIFALSIPIPL